jgi:hypothetical protein
MIVFRYANPFVNKCIHVVRESAHERELALPSFVSQKLAYGDKDDVYLHKKCLPVSRHPSRHIFQPIIRTPVTNTYRVLYIARDLVRQRLNSLRQGVVEQTEQLTDSSTAPCLKLRSLLLLLKGFRCRYQGHRGRRKGQVQAKKP